MRMDTRSGQIYAADVAAAMGESDRRYMREMQRDPTPDERATGKVGRNHSCPCGSGKKFKKCCLWRSGLVASENKAASEAE